MIIGPKETSYWGGDYFNHGIVEVFYFEHKLSLNHLILLSRVIETRIMEDIWGQIKENDIIIINKNKSELL